MAKGKRVALHLICSFQEFGYTLDVLTRRSLPNSYSVFQMLCLSIKCDRYDSLGKAFILFFGDLTKGVLY
ncbi:MAG: hypothetical protein WCP18_03825 [bacterium]